MFTGKKSQIIVWLMYFFITIKEHFHKAGMVPAGLLLSSSLHSEYRISSQDQKMGLEKINSAFGMKMKKRMEIIIEVK